MHPQTLARTSASSSSTRCLHREARKPVVPAALAGHAAWAQQRSAGCTTPACTRGSGTGSARFARLRVSSNGAAATAEKVDSSVPKPIVKLDNITDPFATKVTVEFGDKLGELLDTVSSLKNLGLNIRKAKVVSEPGRKVNTFYITDAETSEKIVRSARLEEIRMTIINNMLYYHPESSGDLAAGKAVQPSSRDPTSPLGLKARTVVQTTIEVQEAPNGTCSVLQVKTRDRPGLLVDIVSVLKDINVNVVSAEVDTIGEDAIDEFFITYHGEPLNAPMVQLVTNALQYYLSLAEVEKEESY